MTITQFEPARDATRDVLSEVFDRLWIPLVTLAAGLTGSRAVAEDVVADVFEAVHRRHLDFGADRNPDAYLRTAVVNRCRSVHRRGFVRRRYETGLGRTDAMLRSVAQPEPAVGGVLDAVARLPRRQREVVILRYWCDLPFDQIAQVLALTPSAVRSTLHRATARLAHLVGETDD